MDEIEQSSALNTLVKVRLAPSKIHGVGVFAIRDLKTGEKLHADLIPQVFTLKYASFHRLLPEVRQILLERWPQVVNGSNFLYPETRLQAYMNHSYEPNYDAINDFLLRDVSTGDEVTEDYRKILNYQQVFPWID